MTDQGLVLVSNFQNFKKFIQDLHGIQYGSSLGLSGCKLHQMVNLHARHRVRRTPRPASIPAKVTWPITSPGNIIKVSGAEVIMSLNFAFGSKYSRTFALKTSW